MFWFGIGAILAMITSIFVDNLVIQFAVFVISSGLLISLTKPFIDKYINKTNVSTNAYSIINKHGIVTKAIISKKSVGQVKIDGEIWSAKSEDGRDIPVDTEIEVLKIDGVKAVVIPVKELSKIN